MMHKLKNFFRSYVLPDSLFLIKGSKKNNAIYLTFDDGPVAGVTCELLNLLAKHNALASFFIIGSRSEKEPDLMSRIAQQGHTLANHSYSHPNFQTISAEEQSTQIFKTNAAIESYTRKPNTLFRAPQGRWSKSLLWLLFKHKMTAVHWSRDSMDFKKHAPEVIIQDFKNTPVQPGEIILFHDDNKLCIEVLDILIPYWQSQGFTMKALASQN